MNYSDVDIEKMGEETGIGIAEIKNALGIPLSEICKASTIEEAMKAYEMSSRGSEAEKASTRAWNKLSLEEINNASTVEEMEQAYWMAQTGSNAKKVALREWNRLSLREISNASTVEKIAEACNKTLMNSKARETALGKWVKLVSNVKEVKKVYLKISREPETKLEKVALRIWNRLSLREINNASTVEKIAEAYSNSPYESETRKIAIRKLATFFLPKVSVSV